MVAALLTLAAVATLALGTTLLIQLDIRLAANRQALALARADSRSSLALFLLELEAVSWNGELPEAAPEMAGVAAYQRESSTSATLSVLGQAASASHRSDARIDLRPAGGVWRIHIAELR